MTLSSKTRSAPTLPIAALVVASTVGCTVEDERTPHLPQFTDISSTADGYVTLIDRTEALSTSEEDPDGGEPIDIATANQLFRLAITSTRIQALDDALDPTVDEYSNIIAGTAAAGAVDLTLSTRIGAMKNALDAMATVQPNEIADNHWSASKSVTNDLGETVSVDFNQRWVGSGWLVEMRMFSQNGAYDDTLWFNGYYQADGTLGWWDFRRSGAFLLVLEWVGTMDDGEAQLVYPASEYAGDSMDYLWAASGGTARWLAAQPPPNPDAETSAVVASDLSGMAMIPDYAEIDLYCWDSNLENIDCPEDDTGGDTGDTGGDTGDTGS